MLSSGHVLDVLFDGDLWSRCMCTDRGCDLGVTEISFHGFGGMLCGYLIELRGGYCLVSALEERAEVRLWGGGKVGGTRAGTQVGGLTVGSLLHFLLTYRITIIKEKISKNTIKSYI